MVDLTIANISKKLKIPVEKLHAELSANSINFNSKGAIDAKDKKKLIFFLKSKNEESIAVTQTTSQNLEHGKNKIPVQSKLRRHINPVKQEKATERKPDEKIASKTPDKKPPTTATKKATKEKTIAKDRLTEHIGKVKPIEPINKAMTEQASKEKLKINIEEADLKEKPKRKRRLTTNDKKNIDVKTLKDIDIRKLDEQEDIIGGSPPLQEKLQTTQPAVNISTKHRFQQPQKKIIKEIQLPQKTTIKGLAKLLNVKSVKVNKILVSLGDEYGPDQSLNFDTAHLIVEELGYKATARLDLNPETELSDYLNKIERGKSSLRDPVVTIMGHVDHGKTTLLDNIRKANVVDDEDGGITQHLSAYHVNTNHGGITFIDTPGHAAFTAMRARGSKFTDIVVLIVAADDGVMPQTIEIIQHVKAAEVPIIIAINKIDRPETNKDKVLQDLSQHDIVTESWAGTVPDVDISALSGKGVNDLLETISLQAEIMELMAPTKGPAQGFVLECAVQKGLGTVVSLIVQQGQLKQGDIIASGTEFGKVRSLNTSDGKKIKQVGPSIPVEMTGFSNLPNAGDAFVVINSEKFARSLCNYRKLQATQHQEKQTLSLEELLKKQADSKQVSLIIKADTQGSCEALAESLLKLSTDEVKVKIVANGVGGIRETDATLAMAHQAVIIGFNTRADTKAKAIIERENLSVKYYSIIYEVIDTVEKALLGQLDPVFKESIIGVAEVRDVFRARGVGAVAGCMVIEGEIKRNAPIRVLRDEVVIYEGALESLRRFKNDVSSVRSNTECGIGVKNYTDVHEGDLIEVFEKVEVKPA